MDLRPKVLSLCAGIGGLDLGIELAFPGARTVCLVEREAACIEILVSRMEEGGMAPAPVWTDVKTFDGTAWRGKVDLVAAGYPCQPFSVAGKGLGDKDPRHLWPDIARIIGEVRPTLVVLENVQGHIKRGLDQVLLDLHELGFDAEWGVYSASQAGAPHRRNRVFVLAHSSEPRLQGDDSGPREARKSAEGRGATKPQRASSPQHEELAYTERTDLAGRGESRDQAGSPGADESQGVQRERSGYASDYCESDVGDTDCEGSQGRDRPEREGPYERTPWPPGPEGDWADIPEHLWPATQSGVRGMVDGVPTRVDQLRALGNAVVPQQAALALRDLIGRIA